MTATPSENSRNAVFVVMEPTVFEAARRVAASPDTDRVVVVADCTCESGKNLLWSMNHGHWMDEWHNAGHGVWWGIARRRQLSAFLAVSWPAVTGTLAALEARAPAGMVWVWVMAAGGCQLRQIPAGGEHDTRAAQLPAGGGPGWPGPCPDGVTWERWLADNNVD